MMSVLDETIDSANYDTCNSLKKNGVIKSIQRSKYTLRFNLLSL